MAAPREETVTMKMRGRPVTHDEAEASAQRLINSHFGNVDGARVSIPARPDNDDILVMDYIAEQRKSESMRGELLEAQKGMLAWAALFNSAKTQIEQAPAVKVARAAIAKAEGRA